MILKLAEGVSEFLFLLTWKSRVQSRGVVVMPQRALQLWKRTTTEPDCSSVQSMICSSPVWVCHVSHVTLWTNPSMNKVVFYPDT